jgi:hypothetical protein
MMTPWTEIGLGEEEVGVRQLALLQSDKEKFCTQLTFMFSKSVIPI